MRKLKYEEYNQHITLLDGIADIQPYFVKLPDPPPIEQFVNYGLPKEKQFFVREHVPVKVRNLDIKVATEQITVDEAIAIAEKDSDISDFIESQWRKRFNGIFIIIYGTPMYITGLHWYYLNYHRLDTGKYADFRLTDRNYFYWRKFCVWDDPKVFGGINFTNRREGKCFGKDTPIRMYDGSVKMVQDIVDGDLVMGTNSEPRKVSGVTKGEEPLYKIIPKKGEPFVCNESHILSMFYSSNSGMKKTGWKKKSFINISVRDYLKLDDKQRSHLCIYRSGWGDCFPKNEHYIDPYILGIYLGDGNKRTGAITTTDKEVADELHIFCKEKNLAIRERHISFNIRKRNGAGAYPSVIIDGVKTQFTTMREMNVFLGISPNSRLYREEWFRKKYNIEFLYDKHKNPYTTELSKLNVLWGKNIPKEYMIDCRENRLKLLAGIIDTDGHLLVRKRRGSGFGKMDILSYEITQKNKQLSYDILELTRSLGFSATIHEKIAKMKRKDETVYSCLVYRINISGNLSQIPCKIKRKKAGEQDKRNNPLNTGITIEEVGVGEYFGFAVDGNHLFLLADGTVVHNSIKSGAEATEVGTRRRNSMVGCQSKTDDDARSFFRKFIVRQVKKLPFYFKPLSDGNKNPINEIRFEIGRSAIQTELEPLDTIIDYRPSTETAYDGEKLVFYIMDEAGKYLKHSPVGTWDKVKYCLIEQDRIIGKAIITTTVEEMEKGGGKAFKELWDESSRIPFHKKINELGQTNSGLIPYFTPAYMGYIFDQYGFPIINDPLPHQQKFRYNQLIQAKEKPEEALKISQMGAIELLDTIEKSKTKESDRQDFRRKFPNTIKSAFVSAFKSCHFSFEKISSSLEQYLYTSRETLEGHPYKMVQGNFQWKNSVRDTEVEFVPSNSGRWKVSYLLPHAEANKYEYTGGMKVPSNSMKGVAGIDPYGFSIVSDTNNKQSLGGGYIWWYYDALVDSEDKSENEYVTDDFIVEYLNRPVSIDIFNEDMIMMCHYYGVKAFIETNKDNCINYFVDRGYGGYLVIPRKVKREGRKMIVVESEKAGAYSAHNTKYKDAIFSHFEWYVEHKIATCKFPRLIEDIRDVEYDNTRPYDAFMAAGYAIYAAKMITKKIQPRKKSYSSPMSTFQVNQV